LLRQGVGRADVYDQWVRAQSDHVKGSPHLFIGDGTGLHNPGVSYHWTGPSEDGGLPRVEKYDDTWADELLHAVHQLSKDVTSSTPRSVVRGRSG